MHVAYLLRVYIHGVLTYYVFEEHARYTHQGKRANASEMSLFLKKGQLFARDNSFGISPVSINC